jgi:hypothetical protein
MKYILISALASCAVMMAADGNSDTAKVAAKVQVVAPVKVIRVAHIDFGAIVLDDYNKSAKVHMRFQGPLANWTPNPATDLTFEHCARYRGSAPYTPGIFDVERDTQVAPSFAGYLSGVRMTYDQSVTLSGGQGGDVLMIVDSDLPAEDFVPASPVAGVLRSRFQVGGTLLIPAKCLGYKEGPFNVSVAYM